MECSNLTTVSIPKAVTIDTKAFYSDTKINSFTAPNVTTIGEAALYTAGMSYDSDNGFSLDLPKANRCEKQALFGANVTELKLTTRDDITYENESLDIWPGMGSYCTLTLHNNKKSGGSGSPSAWENSSGQKYWAGNRWKDILFTD